LLFDATAAGLYLTYRHASVLHAALPCSVSHVLPQAVPTLNCQWLQNVSRSPPAARHADFASYLLLSHQVEMGSTNIRVGSTIFGARDYSKKV